MLNMPPSVMPMLDCSERPSARIRCASRVFIAVQKPPITTVQIRYSTA